MGEVFVAWGGMDLLQSAAIALGWWVEIVSDGIRYVGAEIPPAGAPAGFDSAAVFDFIA